MKYRYPLLLFSWFSYLAFPQITPVDSAGSRIEALFHLGLDELLLLKTSSATKFEESVKDIPHSIYIITKDDIETYGYLSLAEALQHVPGFYMVDDHTFYKQNFGVRGFYRDEWNQNIVFLVNGVRQRTGYDFNNKLSYINIPIQSVEKIEVIKGAASVTYGTGAFMGVVNIITTGGENSTNASVSYGSQNTLKAAANIHHMLNDMSFTINMGAGKTDGINQNYMDMGLDTSVMSGDYMKEDYCYMGVIVQNKHFVSSLTLDKNHSIRPVLSPPYISDIYENDADFIAVRYRIGAFFDIAGKFELNASYQFQYLEEEVQYDAFGLDNNREIQNTSAASHEFDANLKTRIFQKLSFSIGGNLQYTGKYKDELDVPLVGLYNHSRRLLDPLYIYGIYYRMDWSLTDDLIIKGGIKFDRIVPYTVRYAYNIGNNYIDPLQQILGSYYIKDYTYPDYGFSVLPELSLLYHIGKKNTIKLIYEKAVNKLPIFRIPDASAGIKPEYIQNFELNHIGLISDKLSINTSIFYNKYTDLIAVEFHIKEGEYVKEANNSGKISTIGLETSLDYRPSDNIQLYFAGNYNHSTDLNHKSIYPAYSPSFSGIFNISYSAGPLVLALTNQIVTSTQPKFSYEPSDMGDINSPPVGRIGSTASGYLNMGFNLRYTPGFLKGLIANVRISNLLNQKMCYPVNEFNDWAVGGTLGITRTILLTIGYEI